MAFSGGAVTAYSPYNLFDPNDPTNAPVTEDTVGPWFRLNNTNPNPMISAYGTFDTSNITFELSFSNDNDIPAGDPSVMPLLDPNGDPVSFTEPTALGVSIASYLYIRVILDSAAGATSVNAMYG